MTPEDELRDVLHRHADAVITRPAGAAAVRAAARRRTRRNRIATGVAVVGLFVGGGVALLANQSASNDDADSAVTLAADASETTPKASPGAGVAQASESTPTERVTPSPTERVVVTDAGAAPMLVLDTALAGATPFALDANSIWRLDDTAAGAMTWVEVGDPRPSTDAQTRAIDGSPTMLYAVGDGPSGIWAARTEIRPGPSPDLGPWKPMEVPTPNLDGTKLVESQLLDLTVVTGPAGTIISGTLQHQLRLDTLFGPDWSSRGHVELSDSTGSLGEVVLYDEAGGIIERVDLGAAGLTSDDRTLLADDGTTDFAWFWSTADALGTPARDFVALDNSPNLHRWASTSLGLFGVGWNPQFAEETVWWSSDGANWTALPFAGSPSVDDGIVVSSAAIALFDASGPVFTAHVGRDVATLEEVDLGAIIGAGATGFALLQAEASGSVVAAIVSARVGDELETYIVWSTDQQTWQSAGLDTVFTDLATPDMAGAEPTDFTLDTTTAYIVAKGQVLVADL